MIVLVCYDISRKEEGYEKRLRRITQACAAYGNRVQYSVFECRCNSTQLFDLTNRLEESCGSEDSVRVYMLSEDDVPKTHKYGKQTLEWDDDWIF